MTNVGIIHLLKRMHFIFEGENANHITTKINPATSATTPKPTCNHISMAEGGGNSRTSLKSFVKAGIIIIKTKMVSTANATTVR